MKSYQRLLIFILLVLGVTAVVSPWAATAWDLISGASAAAAEDRIPFSRFFDRFFMISGIVLFFPADRCSRSTRCLNWVSHRGRGQRPTSPSGCASLSDLCLHWASSCRPPECMRFF